MKYLAPYDLAIVQVQRRIDRLAQLTADNPSQEARVPELRSLSCPVPAEQFSRLLTQPPFHQTPALV